MTTPLEAMKTWVNLIRDGEFVTPEQLDYTVVQIESEHRALLADNAAVVDALRTIGRTAWAVGASASSLAVDALLAKPHPGAALLSDMESLRKRVAELETDALAIAESAEESEKERIDARAAALEEAQEAIGAEFRSIIHGLPTQNERRSGVLDMHAAGAAALSALATTTPPPVVPVAKVREVLRLFRDHKTMGDRWTCNEVANHLGINIDGEP